MGVLYNWSSPFEHHMSDDSHCIVDDRSCIRLGYRNARYSKTASIQHHSFLILICNVFYTNQHQSLSRTGERIKSSEGKDNIRLYSNRRRAHSPTITVQGQSVDCVDGQDSVDVLTDLFRRWHLADAKKQRDPLTAKDAASSQPKAPLRLSCRANTPITLQEKLPEKPTKDDNTVGACQKQPETSSNLFDDNVHAADVPLPPSPSIPPTLLVYRTKRRQENIAPSTSNLDKRQRDDSDHDGNPTQMLVKVKKARQRTRKAPVPAQSSDAGMVVSTVIVKPADQQSNFDTPRWLDFNWKSVTSFLSIDSGEAPTEIQVQLAVSHAVSVDLQPTPFPFFSTYKPKERVNDNNSFVPAINIFNDWVGSSPDGRRCDALARFADNPGRCLANKKNGPRCNSLERTPVTYQPTVAKLLAELQALNPESNPYYCIYKLAALTNLAVCIYQRKSIRKKLEDLRERYNLEQPADNQRKFIADEAVSLRKSWEFDKPEDDAFIKYLPLFISYHPNESTSRTVDQFVRQQAIADPVLEEVGDGYLYIYWNRATFDVRKIGFTTKDVSDRLSGWEEKCNHVAREQYRSPCKVRHAKRVEALVHADLRDHRVFEPACHTCLQSHIEWFRGVSLEFIIARIEAWSQWTSTEPYKKSGYQWKLTNEGECSLRTVMLSSTYRDPEISRTRPANRPQRYNLRNTKARKSSSKLKHPEIIDIDRKDQIAD